MFTFRWIAFSNSMAAGSRGSVQSFQNATRLQEILQMLPMLFTLRGPTNDVVGATGNLEDRGYGILHPAGFMITVGVEMSV